MSVKEIIPNPPQSTLVDKPPALDADSQQKLAKQMAAIKAGEPVVLLPGGGEIKGPGLRGLNPGEKNPGRYETVEWECQPLNPRHPMYALPMRKIVITAEGKPDVHEYRFGKDPCVARVKFQAGQVKAGINGIGVEHLLALISHKLSEWQEGEHACAENQDCLEMIGRIQDILLARTDRRLNRIAYEGEKHGSIS